MVKVTKAPKKQMVKKKDPRAETEEEKAPVTAAATKKTAAREKMVAKGRRLKKMNEGNTASFEGSCGNHADPAPKSKVTKVGTKKNRQEAPRVEDKEKSAKAEPKLMPGKRKTEPVDSYPAKKAKPDQEDFSVFVGNLNPGKNHNEIQKALKFFFNKHNIEVQDIAVNLVKRHAYVKVTSEDNLKKALGLNGQKVQGQDLRLEKAKKQKFCDIQQLRDHCTLFVKGVTHTTRKEDLKEVFSQAIDIRLPKGSFSVHRGIAYLEFETEAIAEKVMVEKQGAEVKGCPVTLEWTGVKRVIPQDVLVLKNLPSHMTSDSLRKIFNKAVSVRLPKKRRKSTRHAIVHFACDKDAEEAMETLKNTEIDCSFMDIKLCSRKESDKKNPEVDLKSLCVKGLSKGTTPEGLKEAFTDCVSARIAKDKGSLTRIGFVVFNTVQACWKAKKAMAHCEIDGSKVTLEYSTGKRSYRGPAGGQGRQWQHGKGTKTGGKTPRKEVEMDS